MDELTEARHGKFKAELVSGLCTTMSIRVHHSEQVKKQTKQYVSLFKYIFGYFIELEFQRILKRSCRACCTRDQSVTHTCTLNVENDKLKQSNFYFILHSIDKASLLSIFRETATKAKLETTPVCACILYYKSLTLWRPTIRRNFLQTRAPYGVKKKTLSSFLSIVQKWEEGK